MDKKIKEIVVQKDFAYLYLNKDFYPKELIVDTIKVYREFFKSEIKEIGDYFVLKIVSVDSDYSDEILANEFANYLLSEMNRTKK